MMLMKIRIPNNPHQCSNSDTRIELFQGECSVGHQHLTGRHLLILILLAVDGDEGGVLCPLGVYLPEVDLVLVRVQSTQ